jgi:hypothetical protein
MSTMPHAPRSLHFLVEISAVIEEKKPRIITKQASYPKSAIVQAYQKNCNYEKAFTRSITHFDPDDDGIYPPMVSRRHDSTRP